MTLTQQVWQLTHDTNLTTNSTTHPTDTESYIHIFLTQISTSYFRYTMIRKLSSVYFLVQSGFVMRCCPIAKSQVIIGLLFLHIRGGCSLTILLFFLMLMGICCFILSARLCLVRPTHQALHRHENSLATQIL